MPHSSSLVGGKTISDFAFENDIVLPDLNGLPDVSFVNFKSDGKAGSNLYYAFVNLKIKIPSSLKLTVRKIGFRLNDAAGLAVDTMVLDSMILEQGDNTVPAGVYIDSLSEGTVGFMKAFDVGGVAVTLDDLGHATTGALDPAIMALHPAIMALHIKFVMPKKFGKVFNSSLAVFILYLNKPLQYVFA